MKEIGVGVIGCGGFGLFALQQFAQIKGVRLAAIAGTARPAAHAAAQRFGLPDVMEIPALLERSDVDLVYIATPPFLHHEQALAALAAGKHVICEKPLAMNVVQANEMIAAARAKKRLLVANLMQRYNPVFGMVQRLVASQALGAPLHGYFENYGSDENLPAEHWFWDRSKSGGIFIEHGVHFFDLVAGWLGDGRIEAAQVVKRAASDVEDQVHATVRYGDETLFNFYHGFHQPGRLDRQELKLLFERGEITLYEWVPTKICITAIADEATTRTLCELFPGARLNVTVGYSPKDRTCRGRWKSFDVYQMFDMWWGEGRAKGHVYSKLLRAMIADQVAWIRDPSHQRTITEDNGRNSLGLACEADALARMVG